MDRKSRNLFVQKTHEMWVTNSANHIQIKISDVTKKT